MISYLPTTLTMALALCLACKPNTKLELCGDGSDLTSAGDIPQKNSYYHGGFLEMTHQDKRVERCDALIMPYIPPGHRGTLPLKITQWQRVSISVSRMCLAPLEGSKLSLLLSTSSFLGDPSIPSPSNTPSAPGTTPNPTAQGPLSDYDYIKIPLSSDFFNQLATARSQFISKVNFDGQGSQRLTAFERMQSQIFRVINIDYAKEYQKSGAQGKWKPKLDALMKNIQYHGCSFGELSYQLNAGNPSKRYEKLIKYRTTNKQNLACFIYRDLIQFLAEVPITKEQRQAFAAKEPTFASNTIIKRTAHDDKIFKDPKLRSSLSQWGDNLRIQGSHRLEALKRRLTTLDAQPATSQATLPNDLFKATSLDKSDFRRQMSHWFMMVPYGNKAIGGRAKELGGNAMHWFHRTFSQPLPLERNGATEVPHAGLSVAGNVRIDDTTQQVRFYHQQLNKQDTELFHNLFSLMAGYKDHKENQKAHPIHMIQTGSFALLGGQPIAVLLVVNKKLRERAGQARVWEASELFSPAANPVATNTPDAQNQQTDTPSDGTPPPDGTPTEEATPADTSGTTPSNQGQTQSDNPQIAGVPPAGGTAPKPEVTISPVVSPDLDEPDPESLLCDDGFTLKSKGCARPDPEEDPDDEGDTNDQEDSTEVVENPDKNYCSDGKTPISEGCPGGDETTTTPCVNKPGAPCPEETATQEYCPDQVTPKPATGVCKCKDNSNMPANGICPNYTPGNPNGLTTGGNGEYLPLDLNLLGQTPEGDPCADANEQPTP